MTPAQETSELLALAEYTENANPSWLPIAGHVVKVTYSLDQRDIVANALRLAALRAAGDAPAWRDISTAPKDGSKIDLLFDYPRGRQTDCQWREGGVYGDGGWYWAKPQWGSQPGLDIDWHLLPEAEWTVEHYPNMEPTHWMMPPALPRPNRRAPTAGEASSRTTYRINYRCADGSKGVWDYRDYESAQEARESVTLNYVRSRMPERDVVALVVVQVTEIVVGEITP